VDLAAWQKQMSQSAGQSAADIALHEEFMKFKAERNTAAAGAPLPVGEPSGTTTAAIKPETLPAAPDSSVAGSQAGNQNQEGGAAPVVLTAGQRFDKIMSVMFGLTEADMTKSANPMPTVSALNRLTGLDDIEGAERESVFEAFVKANPEWEPKAE
jgi:hypothetical protein